MNTYNTYKKLLAEFVSFKSISTHPKFKEDINKTVSWLEKTLEGFGFGVEIFSAKESNPVVFANFVADKKLPTVLIYGHYDVQPAEKGDGWTENPFKLTLSKNKLVARGVVDNKGQILAHIVSAGELIKSKKMGCNVKFLIEGNEESGNADLASLLLRNRKKFSCDIVLISDGELTNAKPTIEVSLRGGFNCTLKYKTGKTNLHSGIFGGAVPNAPAEMVRFLSKLFNIDNSINYPRFYEGADKPNAKELVNNKNLAKEARIKEIAGVKTLCIPKGIDFFTQAGLYPTIQITGLESGYTDRGYANIVPSQSEVRLNFRIVASQKPEDVAKNFEEFVKENTPNYVECKLSFGGLHKPIKVDTKNPYISLVEKILTDVYKSNVNRKNVGGAIPFVGDVKETLGIDTLLIPFCNEDCNMHGVDENFDVDLIKKALSFSNKFMSHQYLPFWKGSHTVVREKSK
jgi:acetylornithine deacetylase/succinyl-diaminopimelate desuccinylase-like protein